MLAELALELSLVSADHLIDELSVLEEKNCWNRPHRKTLRRLDVRIDVHLHDFCLAGKFGGELVESRLDHAARATPGRPEINHCKSFVLLDLGLEISVCDGNGIRHLALLPGDGSHPGVNYV